MANQLSHALDFLSLVENKGNIWVIISCKEINYFLKTRRTQPKSVLKPKSLLRISSIPLLRGSLLNEINPEDGEN